MNRTLICLLIVTFVTFSWASWTGAYQSLGKTCDPDQQNNGVAKDDDPGKVCFPGSYCNPQSKICDCEDTSDGEWKRTFQNNECRLLPGSRCVRKVNQEYYNCVDNSQCTQTRKGQDESKCPADAPCDIGDYNCVCNPGASCLTQKIAATPA